MKAKPFSKVREAFQPTKDDDHSVIVIQYNKWNAFSDDGYITDPYKFDSLEEMIHLPEHKEGYEQPSYTKTAGGGSTETSKNQMGHLRGFWKTRFGKFTAEYCSTR